MVLIGVVFKILINMLTKHICVQVIDELAELLETPRQQIEQQVHESRCDDLSAMFNMLLDIKRNEKGKAIELTESFTKPNHIFNKNYYSKILIFGGL